MLNKIVNNPMALTLMVVLLALVVVAIIVVAIPYIKKKGINVDNLIEKANTTVDTASEIIDAAGAILPNSQAITILKTVEGLSKSAVNAAEQMKIASELDADKRNEKAKEIVDAGLKVAGITVTPELETVINGAIEAGVLALGHKTQTEAQAAVEKQKLQNQVISLKNENTALQQKISAVQSTVTN